MCFPTIFFTGEDDLGRATAVKHRIDTGAHRPFRRALRRSSNACDGVMDEQTENVIRNDVMEPTGSEWAFNAVLVKKADESMRFCVDYSQLNERTGLDSYPLPRLDVRFDALAMVFYFFTFDLRAGYQQVQIDPEPRTGLPSPPRETLIGLRSCHSAYAKPRPLSRSLMLR